MLQKCNFAIKADILSNVSMNLIDIFNNYSEIFNFSIICCVSNFHKEFNALVE